MRAFIGIDFDTSVKEGIKTIQSVVKQNSEKGRFKHVDNFHITIKFLGEISKENVFHVNEVLENAAAKNKAFNIKINKLGFFKGRESIHALWLGLDYENNSLIDLYNYIEEGLSNKGFKKDNKSYTPHITIAQDLILKTDFCDIKNNLDLSIIPIFDVKRVSLIKSEQIKGKRIYTPISTFELKGL